MSRDPRALPPSARPFVGGATIEPQPVGAIEGTAEQGHVAIKPLLVGREMLFIEVHRRKGLIDPEHAHHDHESVCYLVSGKMRVVIEGEEFIARPGDVWVHHAGVRHYHETLEDSVQIEIKSPPRKTWS